MSQFMTLLDAVDQVLIHFEDAVQQKILPSDFEDPATQKMLAAALALDTWPTQSTASVNLAMLGLSLRPRRVLHELRPGVVHLTHRTDLHSLPAEAPKLLRGAFYLRASHPEKNRLFGETVELAGYGDGHKIFLVGNNYPDGVTVARWEPRWTGEELEASVHPDPSPLLDTPETVAAHRAWTLEAARFAVMFSILLEAEGAPIRLDTERPPARSQRTPKKTRVTQRGGWTTQHIYLAEPPRRSSPSMSPSPMKREGLLAEEKDVIGHAKRQRYGPALQFTKWVYVAGYSARRWVSAAPKRIVVH